MSIEDLTNEVKKLTEIIQSFKKIAYTYDDILIEPKCSTVKSRSNVSLRSRLIGNIYLNLPIVSANMDTITKKKMAITMALNGGAGIIHRNCEIEKQANIVRKVKRYTNFIIEKPYTIGPNVTLEYLIDVVAEKNVSCFPVLDDESGKLIGIITKNNYQLIELTDKNKNDHISKYMIPRKQLIVAQNGISREEAILKMQSNGVNKLLLVDGNDMLCGLITSKDILLHRTLKEATIDSKGQLVVGAAIGVQKEDLERTKKLVEAGVDFICIDISHGHSILAEEMIKTLKNLYPKLLIMAGNVCTAAATKFLCELGVDCVKVGVGPGGICSTRSKTKYGVPQLTAVMNCSEEARKYNIPIVADGGHAGKVGNIYAAIAVGGASASMLGGFLAGTDECPGKVMTRDGKKVKFIRGMASISASKERKNSKSNNTEGTEGFVEYKGKVKDILIDIREGLQSSMSFEGVHNIEELRESEVNYNIITQAGQKESGYHNIMTLNA